MYINFDMRDFYSLDIRINFYILLFLGESTSSYIEYVHSLKLIAFWDGILFQIGSCVLSIKTLLSFAMFKFKYYNLAEILLIYNNIVKRLETFES